MATKEVNQAVKEPKASTEEGAAGITQPTSNSDQAPKSKPKKKRRAVTHGHVYVLATFNNTIITVTDEKGNVLTTASAGSSGFAGSKKGTAYAAQVAAEKAIGIAKQNYGLEKR